MIKMEKHNNLFLLLLVTQLNIHCMDLPHVPIKKPSKKEITLKWITIAGHILLGNMPIQALRDYQTSFADLNNDVLRETIIILLTSYCRAQSLNNATTTLRSLTTINKRLNALINDSLFCLQTIKQLATRFDCSEQEACEEMRTKAAKSRLALQTRLFEMCLINNPEKEEFEELFTNGVHLDFTYSFLHSNKKNIVTPLMLSAITNNPVMISYLLTKPTFINKTDKSGTTALMWAVKDKSHDALQLLCNTPRIALDQQDAVGNTALMHSLKLQPSDYKSAEILINAEASITIANNMKLSPLTFIKQKYQENTTAIPQAIVNKIMEKNGEITNKKDEL